MPRKDRSDKIYFLQYSAEYLYDMGIRRIIRRGNDKFNIFGMYMYAHAIALETGGSIAKDPRLSLEEQIAILINADDDMIDDVRTMLQVCQEYGLIEDDGEAINFTLTEAYTQAYTRQAVDKRRNKDARKPQEEPQAEPEKKPAKKPNKKAEREEEAEALFRDLWKLYPRKEGKNAVSKKAKIHLLDLGREACEAAIDTYSRAVAGRDREYIKMGSSFFNAAIDDYLPGAQDNTPAAAPTQHLDGLDSRLISDGVLSPDAPPDMARWERVKHKYTTAEQAQAERLYLY